MDLCRQFRPRGEYEMRCTQSPDWGQPLCRFDEARNVPVCLVLGQPPGSGGFKMPGQRGRAGS